MEEKQKNIGGLWVHDSKAGNKFMSGKIYIGGQKQEFVVFKNKYKEGKQPDYVIFPPKKRESEAAPAKENADIADDQIPF